MLYVLQFYVAQANTNQQMRWVTGIVDQDDEEDSIEALIRRTRTYRAILSVLPEFTLQRKIDFERALAIIFSIETRWTWLDQEVIVKILQLISSIDLPQTLWKIFGDLSLEDNATMSVEIELLAKSSSPQSSDRERLCQKIKSLLEREDSQNIALNLAVQYDLKVPLLKCNSSKLKEAFKNFHYQSFKTETFQTEHHLRTFLSCQTEERQHELFLSQWRLLRWSDKHYPFLTPLMKKFICPEVEISIFGDASTFRLFPYLCRSFKNSNAPKSWIKKLKSADSLYSDYLISLARAIQEPENSELDNNARAAEGQLEEDINYAWNSQCILGPSVSDFPSIDSWKEFKKKIKIFSIENPKWVCKSIDCVSSESLWICLFFHPDYWPLLIEENLITKDEYNRLFHSQLGDILKLSSVPINIIQSIAVFSDSRLEIPLHKVLKVTLNIFEKEGINRISNAQVLGVIFYISKIKSISKREATALLRRIIILPPLPSVWISAILKICIDEAEPNIEILLNFWEKNEDLKLDLSPFHIEEFPERRNQLLRKLLMNKRDSALRLGIVITSCFEPDIEIQSSLRERLLAKSYHYLNSDFELYVHYCVALLHLRPSLEEFSVWANPDALKYINKSQELVQRIGNRFVNIANSKFNLNHNQLREKLLFFVNNRCDYPATIVISALEAILKIDEANLPALDSKIWKQSLDD